MALRVLLADESSTIRKAVTMVLADYGPDVKSVPSGLDVMTVAQSFQPDIVLIDILLTKKNGYDVALELKSNSSTQNTPIILMWSNFMQIDPAQFAQSKADESIEKPFDSQDLRQKVEKLLPQLSNHPLKGLIKLPRMPEMVEAEDFVKEKTSSQTLSGADRMTQKMASLEVGNNSNSTSAKLATRLDDLIKPIAKGESKALSESPEADSTKVYTEQTMTNGPLFSPASKTFVGKTPPPPIAEEAPQSPNLKLSKESLTPLAPTNPEDDWSATRAGFIVVETENLGEFEEVKAVNSYKQENDLRKQINEQVETYLGNSSLGKMNTKSSSTSPTQSPSAFDEQLLKEEIRQIAERICWQVIPDVAEKIVREELAKLLKGIENNS